MLEGREWAFGVRAAQWVCLWAFVSFRKIGFPTYIHSWFNAKRLVLSRLWHVRRNLECSWVYTCGTIMLFYEEATASVTAQSHRITQESEEAMTLKTSSQLVKD